MATRFDSVHAGSTVLHRAATCTCDKQTARVLGLCAARHLSLCVMRLQLAFDFDLLAHECNPMSKNGFSATIFLNASFLISTSVKSHCTPCSFTVVMSILSSRPKYPSPATLSPKRCLCVSDSTCSQLPMNILPSEDSPSACGSDAAFSFASNCSSSPQSSVCTSAACFLDGRLSVSMASPLLALENEPPLVAVMSCFIVTSSSPIDPIPLIQHVFGLMKRVALVSLHPHVLVLWQDTLRPLHSSPVLHASCPCMCPSDWLGDDCQPWHILDNQVLDRTSFPNLS